MYSFLADVVMLCHFAFILFVIFGSLFCLRWFWVVFLHAPAVLWAVWIQFKGGYCPLTPLENWLRTQNGGYGYEAGFIEHYIGSAIYPGGIPASMHLYLGMMVLIINIAAYTIIIRRKRR